MNTLVKINSVSHRFLFYWNQVLPTEDSDISREDDALAFSGTAKVRFKQVSVSNSFITQNHQTRDVRVDQLRTFLQESCNALVLEKKIVENRGILSVLKRKFQFQVALIFLGDLARDFFSSTYDLSAETTVETIPDCENENDTRPIFHCRDLSVSVHANCHYELKSPMHSMLLNNCAVKRFLLLPLYLEKDKACSLLLASAHGQPAPSCSCHPLPSECTVHSSSASLSSSDHALMLDLVGGIEDLCMQRQETLLHDPRHCSPHHMLEGDLVEDLRRSLQATNEATADTQAAFETLKTWTSISLLISAHQHQLQQSEKADCQPFRPCAQRSLREKALNTLERCLQVNREANAALAADIERVLFDALTVKRCVDR